MNFIKPAVLWALPAAVACTLLYWLYGDTMRKRMLKKFAGGNAESTLSVRKRFIRRVLFLLAVILLTIAAARPHWGEKPLEFNIAQTDALIVFDVSKSMLAEDVAPSRLEHGKWLLRKLIAENPETSFGIVAFAGRAFPVCPVTGDRVSLEQCIDELDCDLVPVGGTNLAAALDTAVKSLQAVGGSTREIILITDGEELTGSIAKELEAVKKANIRLFAIGLGDPAVPALIRVSDQDNRKHFMRDSSGNLVKTRLNEELLKKVAAATGGLYINSSNLNTGLEVLTRELSKMPKDGKKIVRRSLPIERFMLFLVPGFILLVLYIAVDELARRKLSKMLKVYLAAVGIVLLMPDTLAGAVEEHSEEKVIAGEKSSLDLYNQARQMQLENKTADAQKIYEELLSRPLPDDLKYNILHNLGVNVQTLGRLKFADGAGVSSKGDLNGALKLLDEADKNMMQAEELYVNAMKLAVDNDITAEVQQKQLADRKEISELKKKIEELKKLQQQAQEKTQQAQDKNQQQKENKQQSQQQNNPQQKSGQQQQNNQQQKSGQQQQNNQQQNGKSAQQALQDAQKAVNDYQKQASDMANKELEKQAASAAEALKDAQKKQEQGKFDEASKDIEKARKALGSNADKKQNNGNEKAQDKASENKQSGDQSLPQSAEQGKNQMDAKQTDALLDSMSQDEKLLRDAIKSNRNNRRIRPVEKDW